MLNHRLQSEHDTAFSVSHVKTDEFSTDGNVDNLPALGLKAIEIFEWFWHPTKTIIINKVMYSTSIYTARNATGLLQVADFTGLLQVVNRLQQVCWIHQVAASLWKSDLLQLDICRLVASCIKLVDKKSQLSTCIKPVDNLQQTCKHQAEANDANASWYRLDDSKVTSLQQTCCKLRVSGCVNENESFLNSHVLVEREQELHEPLEELRSENLCESWMFKIEFQN